MSGNCTSFRQFPNVDAEVVDASQFVDGRQSEHWAGHEESQTFWTLRLRVGEEIVWKINSACTGR
jgi:hypothetical protein